MTRKKIHVTAEDIRKGKPHKSCGCPVSLAIQRDTSLLYANVGDSEWITNGEMFGLPRSATRFIFRFDRKLPVRPFRFFTEVPDAS